jgi:hypothetical protein
MLLASKNVLAFCVSHQLFANRRLVSWEFGMQFTPPIPSYLWFCPLSPFNNISKPIGFLRSGF